MTKKRVDRKLTYSVLESDLPEYMSIVQNGELSISGIVQMSDERAPVWHTQGGSLDQLDEEQKDVRIELNASPGVYGNSVIYTVGSDFDRSGGFLPFGLKLDKETGVISGEVTRNLVGVRNTRPFFDHEAPVWHTANENWNLVSREEFSLSLDANPVKGESLIYHIVDGGLPFGLKLNRSTGEITGEFAVVITNEGMIIPEVEPKPRWRTTPGRLATKNEEELFNYTLVATPRNGQTISYYVVDGGLPFGIKLNKETGELHGDTAEVYYPELPVLIDNNAPVILTDYNLGSVKQGDYFEINLVASVHGDRKIALFEIYPDKKLRTAIPFGLTFSKQGVIRGDVYSGNKPGVYRFTIVAYDTLGLRSCKIFQMEVLEVKEDI